MKKMLSLALLVNALCFCLFASGQELSISGKILSSIDRTPLPGATISVRGTSVAVKTDNGGRFSIKVPSKESVLMVTYVGYTPQEVTVGDKTSVDVSLEPLSTRENEVVVVGYGTARRKDLSGSIASVSGEQVKSAPITSFEQGLQGRVSGVQVMQGNSAPGGAPQVRIRGANTVLGGNEPLYVIDGVPVYNSALLGSSDNLNLGTQPSNALASINPNDIVSMEVLKDASATAIYGARGANGVVIITTRRGKASDRGRVIFETYYGSQKILNKLDLMNASEFKAALNERSKNVGEPRLPFPADTVTADTDWQDVLFRRAGMKNYSLSFSGGSPASQYNVSTNWFDQDGIMIETNFKRASVRMNLDNRINDRLKLSTSISANRSMNARPINYSLSTALSIAPTLSPYDSLNNFSNLLQTSAAENPLEMLYKTSDKLIVNRVLGNMMGEYNILKNLTYSIRFGLDYLTQQNDIYVKKGNFLYPSPGATVRNDNSNNYLIENLLNYNTSFSQKHRINATVGYTWQENVRRFFQQSGSGFQFDDLGTNNLGAATITGSNASFQEKWNLLSYLGRVNYVYNDKYILTFTGRADGSSRFGANKKWGYFPSGAIAWRVAKENFMQNVDFISDLKLRTSYGMTGNQEIPLYASISRMNSVTSVIGAPSTTVIGYVPTSLANNDLKWEVNKQFDAGIDLAILNNRFTITADYYRKRTDDLLANLPIPGSSGFSVILINSGSIENKGFELGLTSSVIQHKNIDWSVNANFSRNNTKVLKLANETRQFFADAIPSPLDRAVNIIREGEVLSAFYGFIEDGLNANGDVKYVDIDKNGSIDDNDRTILGSPFPDLLYGFNSDLKVKNFYLTVFLQGVSGAKIFNSNDFLIANSLTRISNQLREVNNHWTAANPNPNAPYPRYSNTQLRVSDRFVQDADYLRLKNVVLGYNIPISRTKVKWIESSRVYVSGQNLFTATKYHGFDPEVSQTGSNSLVKGLDRGSYPSSKVITVGMNITFK